jgi:asparagine synthase (glutamine-hydrolysing)
MGGFLYLKKPGDYDANEFAEFGRRPRKVMQARGLVSHAELDREQFSLHIYRKSRIESDNLLQFDNGDFVAAVGTCIYRKSIGQSALRQIFTDFNSGNLLFEEFLGHFAIWIFSAGKLTVFNDYRGLYRICANQDRSIISSSFLAICESLKTRTPEPQGVFEYLAFDSVYGDDSIIREVQILDDKLVHQLLPRPANAGKTINLPEFDGRRKLTDQVHAAYGLVSAHFKTLADLFGNRQSLGLTGGYDSRLILAFYRQAGISPYIYVQGENSSTDVRIAKLIAAGENFAIRHEENEARVEFSIGNFPAQAKAAYLYLDGLPHMGLFDDWALASEQRRLIARPESLRIYGMGGEYFRATFAARDRPLPLDAYIDILFSKTDFSSFSGLLDKRSFAKRFGEKLSRTFELDGDRISRPQMDLAYRDWRLTGSAGPQMTLQNERAFAMTPFAEPIYPHVSAANPIALRNHGRFEAELIKLADPKLASYTSAYGYAPVDGPGTRAIVKTYLKQRLPRSIRPLVYQKMRGANQHGQPPFYLAPDYLAAVFPDGCPNVAPFIDLQSITNHRVLSRALTLELILSGQFAATGA